MADTRIEKRRKRLVKALKPNGLEALLVTNFTNVTYLTGFTGDDSCLLVSRDAAVIISDSRYTTQIAEECPGLDVVIRTNRQPMFQVVGKVLAKAGVSRLGIEGDSMTVSVRSRLADQAKSLELVPTSNLVETLREVKDAGEVAELREAVVQAERGFAMLRASLTGDQSELQVAHDLEHSMRRFGAQGVSFPPIVAAGDRAALPHANPTDALIGRSSFLLVDWGATSTGGYRSDLTRVLVTGKILPKLEKIYKVVLKAQLQAIKAIGPGVRCRDVDSVARNVIERAGFGKNFGHGLGHGIGLDIHEGTRFSPVSDDVLKPGMVMTVEPGIYLPGWGGVRIEDDVLVTRDGCEVLTSVPKEFPEVVQRWS